MKLTYTVELKDWENEDSYPVVYSGSSLILAMAAFKEAHLNNQDVIMFTDDEEGNTLDILENYGQIDNIIKCNDMFKPENKELIKQHKEAIQQKEIYNDQYLDQLKENTELKKQINTLQSEIRQLKQQLNNIKVESNKNIQTNDNTIYWYEYRLRGFSPFCQPKGHIDHNDNIGRHGIIAYNRELTRNELEEYELIPYNKAV